MPETSVRFYDRKDVGSSTFLYFSGIELPVGTGHVHHCSAVGNCDLARAEKSERMLAVDLSGVHEVLTTDLYEVDGTAVVQVDLSRVAEEDRDVFASEIADEIIRVLTLHNDGTGCARIPRGSALVHEEAVLATR